LKTNSLKIRDQLTGCLGSDPHTGYVYYKQNLYVVHSWSIINGGSTLWLELKKSRKMFEFTVTVYDDDIEEIVLIPKNFLILHNEKEI